MIFKNLKIFLRNKASLTVLLVSLFLLIIILIPLFRQDTQSLVIAYYQKGASNVTDSIKMILNQSPNVLIESRDEQACIDSVKKSTSKICIIFPENLSISEDFNQSIEFVIDQSKINIAYLLLDRIKSELNLFTKSKQYEYIDEVLDSYKNATENISQALSKINDGINLVSKINNVNTHIQLLLSQINTNSKTLDAFKLKESAFELVNLYNRVSDLTQQTISLFDDLYENIEQINESYNFSEQELNLSKYFKDYIEIKFDYLRKKNHSNEKTSDLLNNVNDFAAYYQDSKSNLELIEQKKEAISEDLSRIEETTNGLLQLLSYQKSILEKVIKNYNSLPIKETETLVEPIKTKIIPIFESNNESVILPSVLSLLIIFSSLLFSSSIVVSNKLSRGSLREILSRKNKMYFYLSSFFSSFVIVLIELFVFIVIISLALHLTVNQILWFLLLLLISIPIFCSLGILIGNLSSSKETAAFFSLILTVVLLILSGDLMPVEFFPEFVKHALMFSPYEIFKKFSFNIVVGNLKDVLTSNQLATLSYYLISFLLFSYLTFNNAEKIRTKMLNDLSKRQLKKSKLKPTKHK